MNESLAQAPPRLLTVAEVAPLLGVHPQTVWRGVRLHGWPHTRVTPSRVRFTAEQVQQIIAMSSTEPAPPRQRQRRRAS